MRTYYPEIEPYATGMLDVGNGQGVYWEESGNPEGRPVVFLHGGPGGATAPRHRRAFDPERYRIILFDQRGAGRSLPHASEPGYDLALNTTWHLVADLELLRADRGVDAWQVFGGSWGSTLALAYAQAHPTRVTELVLRGIFTLRQRELEWFYEGAAGQVFPEVWEQYVAQVPVAERGSFIAAYHRLLNDPDPAVHVPAAVAWSTWESSAITLLPDPGLVDTFAEPRFAVAFARIENHYFVNRGWLEEGQLIANAHLLRDIPTVIVQGRYDMCTPPATAWDLHRALPEAEFVMVPDAGHSFDEPGILSALIEATDRFAG
jgi:proline iminopeptidase